MRAAVLTNPGASPPQQCFTYTHDYPRPTLPSPDWVLVRIRAAGVNRAELRSRAAFKPFPPEFNIWIAEYHEDPPAILGEEYVGEIDEAGSNTPFRKGDKVAGWVYGGGKAHDGAYAEIAICHKRRVFRLPETSLPWTVLGAIPMSMYTAYGCIEECARLSTRPKPASVLVHGGTSSVGIWAVLLAKGMGAEVIATTRNPAKVDKLRNTGADHIILEDRIDEEVPKLYPGGVDVVVELIGPANLMRVLNLTARHGTVSSVGVLGGWDPPEDFHPLAIPPTRSLSFYTSTNSGPGGQDAGIEVAEQVLADVVKKVEDGTVPQQAFLDKTFQLAEVGDAHLYCEENRATGKVVIVVP